MKSLNQSLSDYWKWRRSKMTNLEVYLAWDRHLQEPVALKKDYDNQTATVVRLHNVASGYATQVDVRVATRSYSFAKDLNELETRYTNLVQL